MLLGTPGKDLRLIAVIGDEDDDITKIHLKDIDTEVEYNGTQSELEDRFLFKNKNLK